MTSTKLDLVCILDGCTRLRKARGRCPYHYEKARLAGEFGEPGKECQVESCHRKHAAKGYCQPHYDEYRHELRKRRSSPNPKQHLIYLRSLVGVPADGPTEDQRRRWALQEAS